MRSKTSYFGKIRFQIIIILAVILVFTVILSILIQTGPRANSYSWLLGCKTKLEKIGKAIELYRKEHSGLYPHTLLELKSYLKGPLKVSYPLFECVGERSENDASGSWEYVYDPNTSGDVVRPICWDSRPHKMGKRNVLFSDGEVKHLKEDEFLRLMRRLGVKDPNTPHNTNNGSPPSIDNQ